MSEDSSLHRLVASFIDPENKENFGEQFLERLNELIRTGSQNDRGYFTTYSGYPMYVSTLIISTRHGVSRINISYYYDNIIKNFFYYKNLKICYFMSQAPETSKGPRDRLSRSGQNGDDQVTLKT